MKQLKLEIINDELWDLQKEKMTMICNQQPKLKTVLGLHKNTGK